MDEDIKPPRDALIEALAEILAGLQVPYSIGPAILGAAGPAVLDAWHLIADARAGWKSAREFELDLRVILDG